MMVPFRLPLIVPSWVIPGTCLENLRFLEDKKDIDGVELLFFLYDEEIKALLDKEWAGIHEYARRFTFTAHLPDVLKPEHEELTEKLLPLVKHYIVHPAPADKAEEQAGFLTDWMKRYGASRFVLENTHNGRLEKLLSFLPEAKICMDTGHLLLDGKNPAAFFAEHRSRIAEIHLHGLDREKALLDGRLPDHRPLAGDPWLRELLPMLDDPKEENPAFINLEVFSWEEVLISIATLKNKGEK
jgi:sugar phosphate isomerase/epimerase